ncbi:MAG: hypothetical protein V1720_14895 [bacterium]
MKKTFLLIFFLPVLLSAQYNIETTNEKGFEQSPLQFNSYFLNPYGIYYFKEVTPGLINDPFINLYLNPANIPCIGENDFHFYLDFRGDRTENEVVTDYAVPMYDSYSGGDVRSSWVDPRYIVQTRTEPEPLVSFGFITYPISEITKKFFVAATYQIISKNENFYNTPYYIYSPIAADAYNESMPGYENIPINYAYNGIDEMMTTSHLFSFYTGYEFVENLSVGLGLNAVVQKRSGEYGDTYNNPGYYEYYDDYLSSYAQSRTNKYNHLDWSLGINYNITPKFTLGLKVGLLNGKAEQDYNIYNMNNSDYQYPSPSSDSYRNMYYSNSDQGWDREGNTKYFSLNFKRAIDENKTVKGYYRFTNSDLDITNFSNVLDSTNYESQWTDSYSKIYYSIGRSYLSDVRKGVGEKTSNKHEVMINFDWILSDVSHVMIGAYYYNTTDALSSSEPVVVSRNSDYRYTDYNSSNLIHEYREEYHDKVLEWKSDANYWSFQIPIIMQFTLSENWGLIFGLNRVLNSWEITDETTAYYNIKKTNNNGVIEEKRNFGERYKMPTERISDDATRFFGGVELNITDAVKTKIMFEPEFENEFRIAQWWLSFGANL